MANKKFTPEEIAILKANPYVMEVTEDIIHFSASFKSSFWDRLQNGMKPPDIFRYFQNVRIRFQNRHLFRREFLVGHGLSSNSS